MSEEGIEALVEEGIENPVECDPPPKPISQEEEGNEEDGPLLPFTHAPVAWIFAHIPFRWELLTFTLAAMVR